MVIWMKVTTDKYELPIAVANSAKELAQIVGTTTSVIYTERCQYRAGKRKTCPWVCVQA